jgi:hypothetical protein
LQRWSVAKELYDVSYFSDRDVHFILLVVIQGPYLLEQVIPLGRAFSMRASRRRIATYCVIQLSINGCASQFSSGASRFKEARERFFQAAARSGEKEQCNPKYSCVRTVTWRAWHGGENCTLTKVGTVQLDSWLL